MPWGLCCEPGWGEPSSRDLDPRVRRPVGVPPSRPRRLFMVWQTPAATDIRFGFEITLYVAAR